MQAAAIPWLIWFLRYGPEPSREALTRIWSVAVVMVSVCVVLCIVFSAASRVLGAMYRFVVEWRRLKELLRPEAANFLPWEFLRDPVFWGVASIVVSVVMNVWRL